MKRKGLLNDVLRAFTEFQERRLWKRFNNFHCLGVEVAGEEEPLLASVMGSAGEEFGLMLLRGPEAVDQMRSMQSMALPGSDTMEEADLLSISLEPFGGLPQDYQAFYRQAGIHPRFDEQVPIILIKPPRRRAHLPDDAELAILLNVLETIVAADRRKLLAPTELDDPDGICVVTPAGTPNAEVSVHRERLPRRAPVPREIEFFLSPQDLTGLNLLNETWLVGTPSSPAGIMGEDRTLRIFLVVEEKSGMILEGRPFFADQLQEAISILVETFHGSELSGGRKGLPRKIVFSNRELHDAASPALRKAGVQCKYRPSIPGFQEILASMMDAFGGAMPGMPDVQDRRDPHEDEVPVPDDLAGWKEADLNLCHQFGDFLHNGDPLRSPRASKRYFGDLDFEYYLKEHEARNVAMAYASWGVVNYRPTRKSKTQAEKMLARGLPPAQEMLLRARMEAHHTIYRVAGLDPKAGTVDLEDIVLGSAVKVHDQLLSENNLKNLFVPARVYAAGQFHFLETVGPPLAAGMGEGAVDFLEECGMEFTREGLRRDAHMFGWLWGWVEDWQAEYEPPHLTNTDGDDLLWHTASFSAADPEAARRALRKRSDIEYDDHADEFVWTRKTGKGAKMLGGPVTLGRIECIADELVLTVNSVERFKKARKWLGKLRGIEFKSVTTRRMDEPEHDRPMDERIAKPEPVEITGEMAAAIQEMIDKQSMAWLDLPVPALGGISPRLACRTPEGRRKVTMMIRTMPDPMGNAPVKSPRKAMLRELGLDTGPEETQEAEHSASASPPTPPLPFPDSADFSPPMPGYDNVGRNDPCPCGSGKKYKKCCGR